MRLNWFFFYTLEYPLSSCFILGFFVVVVPVLSGFASIIWVPWGVFFLFPGQ